MASETNTSGQAGCIVRCALCPVPPHRCPWPGSGTKVARRQGGVALDAFRAAGALLKPQNADFGAFVGCLPLHFNVHVMYLVDGTAQQGPVLNERCPEARGIFCRLGCL